MYKSKLIPKSLKSLENETWQSSTISFGLLFSCNAFTSVGVPWQSVPDTNITLSPLSLWYLAITSPGKLLAAWPICNSPLAKGQLIPIIIFILSPSFFK